MAATIEASPRAQSSTSAWSATPQWLADPRHRYLVLGGAVVAIALVTWLVLMSGRRKEAFAGRALTEATSIAESGNLPLAASELQKITTTYGGTRAAQEAVIRLNQVRLVNGQSELAAVGLQDFIKSGPAPQFRTTAYALLGRALENSKRPVDAAAAYLSASEAADVDYLKAEHLMDAARAYVNAGDKPKATETYRRLLKDYPTSSSRTEAEVRLAELTAGAM
jgi:outer membrane protein assembly factor BamD (BamD/ComL family)